MLVVWLMTRACAYFSVYVSCRHLTTWNARCNRFKPKFVINHLRWENLYLNTCSSISNITLNSSGYYSIDRCGHTNEQSFRYQPRSVFAESAFMPKVVSWEKMWQRFALKYGRNFWKIVKNYRIRKNARILPMPAFRTRVHN